MFYPPYAPLVLHGPPPTTWDEQQFFAFWHDNRHLRIERLPTREPVILPPHDFVATQRLFDAELQLLRWHEQQTGTLPDTPAAYRLPDGAVRLPAASWLSAAHRERAGEADDQFPAVCPDFVLEIMSAPEQLAAAQTRMSEWLAYGVQLGFLLTESAELTYIYRPGQPAQELHSLNQELSGEAVLPGFRLRLCDLREE